MARRYYEYHAAGYQFDCWNDPEFDTKYDDRPRPGETLVKLRENGMIIALDTDKLVEYF